MNYEIPWPEEATDGKSDYIQLNSTEFCTL